MTEASYYSEENFNLSYEHRQKELRRMIISMRCHRNWSVSELAEKSGIPFSDLNKMELGDVSISLLSFAKILDACGCFDNQPIW